MSPQPFESFDMDADGGSEAMDQCAPYESFLTAFFDGEATAEEERAVRAHLDYCARCSALWKQWGSTRYLLQSAPLPVVPTCLLTRILMACRLSALQRKPQRSVPLEAQWEAQDMRVLSAHHMAQMPRMAELSDGVRRDQPSPSVRSVTPSVPPVPPHLRDQILRLTVGAAAEAREAEARAAEARQASRSEQSSRPSALAAWSRRTMRCTTAMAVPAMAIWLMVIAQYPGPLSWRAPATSALPTSNSASAKPTQPAVAVRAPLGSVKVAQPMSEALTSSSVAGKPFQAVKAPVSDTSTVSAEQKVAAEAPTHLASLPRPTLTEMAAQRRSSATRMVIAAPRRGIGSILKPVTSSATPSSQPRTMAVRIPGPRAAAVQRMRLPLRLPTRLAALSTADGKKPVQRGSLSANRNVSARPASAKRTEAKPETVSGVESTALAEIWDEVNDGVGDHPESVQQIVDDYRLSLLEEDLETDPSVAATDS